MTYARILATTLLLAMGAQAAEETWKQPLDVKERALEDNIRARHNILGLYPSQVRVPLRGGDVDDSTLGIGNIAHSVCWTANYLAGASFRYATLKKEGAPDDVLADAKARADEIFEAVYRCQLVTGVRGLQARGYAIGHGESYEERWDARTRNEWHQGEGEYKDLRWRGDPSHHNYSDSVHGLMQYWRLAAEGEQKERATEAIDALVSYWVDNDLMIHKLDRERMPTPILGFTDGSTLNTRILMAIAGAKYAHYVTGEEKFKETHDKLIEQYGVRGLKSFAYEKSFDDGEHVFCHLENLLNIEEDPELLKAYRVVIDTMWKTHRDDGQSLFTYIYAGVTPDAKDMDKPMEQAHQALYTWPTDTTLKPRMNSLTQKFKPPYPVYAAAWDNEYIWKGNLLSADRWLSRIIVDLWGGWYDVSEGLPSAVRAIEAGPKVRMVYAACDNGFYASITGGYDWNKLPVPKDGGRPIDIMRDPDAGFVLYATTTKGAYRSPDFGEEFLGQQWETLSEGAPQAGSSAFYVAPGVSEAPGRVYAVLDDVVFTRTLDNPAWTRQGAVGLRHMVRGHADAYPWFAVDPQDPDHIITGLKTGFGGFGTKTLLQHSHDAGASWEPDIESLYEAFHTSGLLVVLSTLVSGDISQPVFDPEQPGVLYAGTEGGVLVSKDGGKTWNKRGMGLDIPRVRTVFVPRAANRLFAGTPAGLYHSEDGAKNWRKAHITNQFIKNNRRQIGGAAYIDAFWRARFYGFITKEDAVADWEE